jgi:tetratricopeptide (TPR) repeat protein
MSGTFVKMIYIPLILLFLFPDFSALATIEQVPEGGDANFYYKKGNEALNPQDKIEYYRRAIELDPELIVAYINLGVAYLQQQRPAEATEVLERAYHLRPDDPLVRQNLSVAYIQLGVSFYNQRLYTEALKEFEKALELDPNDKFARQNLSSTYTNMGVEFYNKRRLEEAAQAFQKALDINPNNQTARYNLSLVRSQGVTSPPSLSPSPTLPPVPSSPPASRVKGR